MTRLGTTAGDERSPLSDDQIDELVKEHSGTVDLEYLQGRLIDEGERLYFKQLRHKLTLAWTVFGNAALCVFAIVAPWTPALAFRIVLLGILVLSVSLCLIFLYVQHKGIRHCRTRIRKLSIAHRRNKELAYRDLGGKDGDDDKRELLAQHKRYRAELPEAISEYRAEASRYRRWHNLFQGVIIVGSVAASAITTASVSYEEARWIAVGVSAAVGLAAGFSGYFKYRERSFNLQQTADAIEREYESVELRVRLYSGMLEGEAYARFANYVETLRDEQAKRQQQLDQPVDAKQDQAAQ